MVTPWDKGMYKCVMCHGAQQHQGETILHLFSECQTRTHGLTMVLAVLELDPLQEDVPLDILARPQVSEIQVLPEWDPRDKVTFPVQLHNFYPREVPPIQWGWDGAGSWGEDPAQIDKNTDGTFTATSVWRVPSRSLTWPELRVRVCVQHGPGEPASERELSLRATGHAEPDRS
ncbi:hypothetical protein Y1Q_0021969 [Alligator mississippiensis]|uniref:Uncharacterized protein n=1 Tax=Alligator mississippiensis TaxID=8496 RepID=A0A151MRE5_ALLMI|nr:hypothetical protein Y1Q_0021969 [Alligator mississippiensis]